MNTILHLHQGDHKGRTLREKSEKHMPVKMGIRGMKIFLL